MKNFKRRYFTLIELMFVVGILVLLIGISWVAGNQVMRKQAENKTRGEITMLLAAAKQYKERWGAFPGTIDANMTTTPAGYPLNFGEYLSKVHPNTSGWSKKRPMFIDFKKAAISVSNTNYDASNAGATTVNDPYENAYRYKTDGELIEIWSVGVDGTNDQGSGDDVSSSDL